MNKAFTATFSALTLAACGAAGDDAAPTSPPPPAGATSIATVQGSGTTSPIVGQTVTVGGIVTGDFQDNDADAAKNLGGFYVQTEMPDGDDRTSDGLFVFDGTNPATDVDVGDAVSVTGDVQEFFGETQISASFVSVTGSGTILATDLNLPVAGATTNDDGDLVADLERYEGMLVRFPQTLSITELFNLERYGEVRLSQNGRLFQFTNDNSPDAVGYASHRENNAVRTLLLDDGKRQSNVSPIRYLDNRLGDTVSGLTGVLRYSRGSGTNGRETWRLMPTIDPVFVSANPRPGAPAVGGALRVASFNVLNFFSTPDTGRSVCGPSGTSGCRGADNDTELNRQLAKITTALVMIDADIAGLIELENNATESLDAIVDALNTSLGASAYAYLDTGTIGDDAIKVGFIYKPASVSPSGDFELLTSTVDARFNDDRNRPVLAQTFSQSSSGALITIAVAHLKSKGSSCDDIGDPNINDGQGNCNRTRATAAAATADWLLSDPTDSGDSDFLLIGDLNAYIEEDPLTALATDGRVNLVAAASGSLAYSFVFDGQAGALDHAVASAELVPQITETTEWHINADESPAHDYNLENGRDAAIFDPATPYRASDHDPVIIGLDLTSSLYADRPEL